MYAFYPHDDLGKSSGTRFLNMHTVFDSTGITSDTIHLPEKHHSGEDASIKIEKLLCIT